MDKNVYCPYCGIPLTITNKKESKSMHTYHVEGCCCNCEKKFHWISSVGKNGVLRRAGFSQFYKSET